MNACTVTDPGVCAETPLGDPATAPIINAIAATASTPHRLTIFTFYTPDIAFESH